MRNKNKSIINNLISDGSVATFENIILCDAQEGETKIYFFPTVLLKASEWPDSNST